jgi:hypothetical protein
MRFSKGKLGHELHLTLAYGLLQQIPHSTIFMNPVGFDGITCSSEQTSKESMSLKS